MSYVLCLMLAASCSKQIEIEKDSSSTIDKLTIEVILSKKDSFLNDININFNGSIASRNATNFNTKVFSSLQEMQSEISTLDSLEITDLTTLELNSDFISYRRLLENYIDQSEEIVAFLDSIVEHYNVIDTVFLNSLYDSTIAPALEDNSDCFNIVINEQENYKYAEVKLLNYDVISVVNPLGLVIVSDTLLHYHEDGLDFYQLSNIETDGNTFSLEQFRKIIKDQTPINLTSRTALEWTRRCEDKEGGRMVIVDHGFHRIPDSSRPGITITTFNGSARAFRGRLWGAWYDSVRARQLRIDWLHSGNIVSCSDGSRPSVFQTQPVNWSGGGSSFRRDLHGISVSLPVIPG